MTPPESRGSAETPAKKPAKLPADDEAAEREPDLTYEQARDELVETVRRLEAGGTTLEESLALWERGEQLAAMCQRFLDGVRERLDAVVESARATDASESDQELGAGRSG